MSKKIFIPLSIEQQSVSRKSYFFTSKKGIMTLFIILPSVLWVPYMASKTPGSVKGLVIGVLIYVVFCILFVRFIVFEEKTWKKIFNERENNKLSSYKYFWGIDRVDNSGLIHYRYSVVGGVKNAVIVKIIQGYSVGRDENYETMYKRGVQNFFHELLEEGYTYKRYIQLDKKGVPEGIKKLYESANNFKDPLLKEVSLEHINHLAYRSKMSKTVVVNYIVIYVDKAIKLRKIYNEVENLVKDLRNLGYFKACEILDKNEVENYLIDHLNISTFPSDMGKYNFDEFSKYGDIIRIFNDNGNEEWSEGIDFKNIFKVKEEVKEKVTEDTVSKEEDILEDKEISEVLSIDDIYEDIESNKDDDYDVNSDNDDDKNVNNDTHKETLAEKLMGDLINNNDEYEEIDLNIEDEFENIEDDNNLEEIDLDSFYKDYVKEEE